ncbi:MAG: 2-amino-4-hydroxy-6-hydroxymethyldihydropteridine diphosphokinase [Desulfuromonadaceae bacterium]|nr:2-amino-4-hydroxy-6-hydroxymethyldihydropteridine diphosphokinase [Desulfuromonadaceae bacterium]
MPEDNIPKTRGQSAASKSDGIGRGVIAYIALGSNLGDRLNFLRRGRIGLEAHGVRILTSSAVYSTEPVGGPQEQQDYYNAVLQVEVDCTALELLKICQTVEQAAGRERRERWGARTLDIDVLLFGTQRINTKTLQVPHPRMFERRFVLEPLAQIAPTLVPSNRTQDIVSTLQRLPETPRVRKEQHSW